MIAADARVGEEDLGWYASVADTLLRYEHIGANRHYGWLAEQASCDWLLLLDGDEIVSDALLQALPELAADRKIEQYSSPIHWPWPTPVERLVSEPWASDRRLRLIRNDGRLAFHGRKHALALDDFPTRHLDQELAVHHLDLLLASEGQRAAKVLRYDDEAFGMMTAQGRPFNEAFYLPERAPSTETAPLTASDRERIAAALARVGEAPEPPSRVDPHELALSKRNEINRFWALARPDGYAGSVRVEQPLPRFTAGATIENIWVRVRNDGDWPWRWGLDRPPLVRLGVRWRREDGEMIEMPSRSPFPCTVEPGAVELVAVSVQAPDEPGHYELLIDVVHENVRWFDVGTPEPVEVAPSVTAELEVLALVNGHVVSLESVRALRAAAGRPNALLGALAGMPDAAVSELDPALRELLCDHGSDPWAPDVATLAEIAALVRRTRPGAVLELGSGVTTVLLAALMRELHAERAVGAVVALEHDPHWRNVARDALAARCLAGVASVHSIRAPAAGNSTRAAYEPTENAMAALRAAPPELVIIHGQDAARATHIRSLSLAQQFARADATLLLDHALRDAELLLAEQWSHRDDVVVEGIALTGNGILIGRLPGRPAARSARRLLGLLRRVSARA
ncbi:MAG TPA: hypothetical protein VGM91_08820 [Conexibacter sp.]